MINKKSILCILFAAVIISVLLPVQAETNTFYVAENGTDASGFGTFAAPFKTIQYAADQMKPGDICYIREGTYRECVTPKLSGNEGEEIKFSAYMNEKVVISGGKLLTNWTKYKDNIYKTNLNMNYGIRNMIYASGKMMHEARWPNSDNPLDVSSYATVDSLSSDKSEVFDSDLQLPSDADYYDGAIMWSTTQPGYSSKLAQVAYYNAAAKSLSITGNTDIAPGSLYYLMRSLTLLDAENEWYIDKSNNLYLYAPGGVNPSTIETEARIRDYGFDLAGKSYITISGISFRAVGINMDEDTTGCVISGGVFNGIDYYMPATGNPRSTGLTVSGQYNTVRDCEIKNNYGPGIVLEGAHNNVINNHVHDVNYQHTYGGVVDGGAININGRDLLISHNTIHNVARDCISGKFKHCIVQYNDMYDYMILSKDGGGVYFAYYDFENSEIHHNLVHDNKAIDTGIGIYLDSMVSGVIAYNNVIWNNPTYGIEVNSPNAYSAFYNNTVADIGNIGYFPSLEHMGSVFVNNIFSDSSFIKYNGQTPEPSAEMFYSNNLVGREYYDSEFQPMGGALEGGIPVYGVTDGYTGSAPDCGAYQSGTKKFTAGCDMKNKPYPKFEPNDRIPCINKMNNRAFENGSFDSWTVNSGNPKVIKQSAWEYRETSIGFSGYYGAMLSAGDKIENTVTGLKPNTTYKISAYGKIGGVYYDVNEAAEKSNGFTFEKFFDAYTKIKSGSWMKFSNVDFNLGYYGEIGIYAGRTASTDAVEIRCDGPDGMLIASMQFDGNGKLWNIYNAEIFEISGIHDVYVVFKSVTDNFILSGIQMKPAYAMGDTLEIGAYTKSGRNSRVEIDTSLWSEGMRQFTITTGPEDYSVTVYAEKTGGLYCAFADNFGIADVYEENIWSDDISVESIDFTDMSGNTIEKIADSGFVIGRIRLRSVSGYEKNTKFIFASYSSDNRLQTLQIVNTRLNPYSEHTIGIGMKSDMLAGNTVRIFLLDEENIAKPVYKSGILK